MLNPQSEWMQGGLPNPSRSSLRSWPVDLSDTVHKHPTRFPAPRCPRAVRGSVPQNVHSESWNARQFEGVAYGCFIVLINGVACLTKTRPFPPSRLHEMEMCLGR